MMVLLPLAASFHRLSATTHGIQSARNQCQCPGLLGHCLLAADVVPRAALQRCRASGVDVTLEVFDRMWHEFQIHAGVLRESDDAVSRIAEFLRFHFAARVDAQTDAPQAVARPS